MNTDKESYWKLKISELEMRIEQLEKALQKKEEPDYYTIDEYAKKMKVCTATVYSKIKDGSITAEKIGKCWRIPK